MAKKKGKPDLSQWYKATPEGARARRHLMHILDVTPAETGAVGETDVRHTKAHPKKRKSKDAGGTEK